VTALLVPGGPALSPARLARRRAAIAAACPGALVVAAEHVYVVATARPLTAAEHAILDALLERAPAHAAPADATRRYVTPRLGTMSPWSSKATDIAHTSGLAAVTRIERATAWTVRGAVDRAALDAALAGAGRGRSRARPGAGARRDRLPGRGLPRARPRSHRRRADDVRAGQQRALPAQDLQRAAS
jgi:hypothetical protein